MRLKADPDGCSTFPIWMTSERHTRTASSSDECWLESQTHLAVHTSRVRARRSATPIADCRYEFSERWRAPSWVLKRGGSFGRRPERRSFCLGACEPVLSLACGVSPELRSVLRARLSDSFVFETPGRRSWSGRPEGGEQCRPSSSARRRWMFIRRR